MTVDDEEYFENLFKLVEVKSLLCICSLPTCIGLQCYSTDWMSTEILVCVD